VDEIKDENLYPFCNFNCGFDVMWEREFSFAGLLGNLSHRPFGSVVFVQIV
jgi:hypothetical protein